MSLTVLLFAGLREAVGSDAVAVELPAGATVADLRGRLAAGCPAAAPLLARSRVAVNQEFAPDDRPIPAGAEVAVIPPVSGG